MSDLRFRRTRSRLPRLDRIDNGFLLPVTSALTAAVATIWEWIIDNTRPSAIGIMKSLSNTMCNWKINTNNKIKKQKLPNERQPIELPHLRFRQCDVHYSCRCPNWAFAMCIAPIVRWRSLVMFGAPTNERRVAKICIAGATIWAQWSVPAWVLPLGTMNHARDQHRSVPFSVQYS